ncbi:MAG: biotin/lipoyl-binding protein [Pseudomonadota bacterium]|nr:biotin/lipoyl-binding protein [Pseudomonadota bacterium]
MLELFLCSLFTIFPDYLYRRYKQGKRFGREINLFSVWYELRWGITGCLILTVLLITTIFYFHPSTSSAVTYYRTVPIVPEGIGRVDEVYVKLRDEVKAGDPIFRLDSSKQKAALETAVKQIAEVDASMLQANADAKAAEGSVQETRSALKQAQEEIDTKKTLNERNPGTVATREIDRLQNIVDSRQGALSKALANKEAVDTKLSSLLPAQKASVEAARNQAQVELDKMTVYAGVDGRLEQFTLRKGDLVNPLMRPAGVLVPSEAGRRALVAGFGQIEAQVMKKGMTAEALCLSKPLTIIPLVVTDVQDVIAAGQLRASDQLVDPSQTARPGTITVFLEPIYKGGIDGIPPGSHCIANAYTSNHERLAADDVGFGEFMYLHFIDAVGLVHAILIRIQALLLPIKTLVLSGH